MAMSSSVAAAVAGASYVSIREDAGIRSMSVNERDFLTSCALAPQSASSSVAAGGPHESAVRADGRSGTERRRVQMHLSRNDQGAECTVQWGTSTRVTAALRGELVPPGDRPNEGAIHFSVDLSPMATTAFRLAPPTGTGSSGDATYMIRSPNYAHDEQRLLANRILRCVERIVVTGGALDAEALCLVPGQWVWRLTVAITVLDHGGNLLDASVLAAMAALRHYRKPQVDLSTSTNDAPQNETGPDQGGSRKVSPPVSNRPSEVTLLPTMISSNVKEATPLPLHHTPLSVTFALFAAADAISKTSSANTNSSSTYNAGVVSDATVAALLDPTDREELAQSGVLTIAMNRHSEVCLMDFGGGCEVAPQALKACWEAASISVSKLCKQLEDALAKADTEAQKKRLEALRRQQQQQNQGTLDVPTIDDRNSPYANQMEFDDGGDGGMMNVDEGDEDITRAQSAAEEAYRQQALDYNIGHVATVVREDEDSKRKHATAKKQAGSLMATLLRSVQQQQESASGGKELRTKEDSAKTVLPPPPEQIDIPAAPPAAEIDSTTGKSSSKQKPTKPTQQKASVADSDEEEEATTMLKGEFSAVPPKKVEDVSDLAGAIKKKKKSKSKSKKSK